MRNVYNLPDLLFCPDAIRHAVALVPEVTRWTLDFRRQTSRWPLRSNILDTLKVDFANGSTATIQGPYLWKFRDSIPDGFGDDDVGYLDDNPYCGGPTEDLVNRIRAAHDAFYVLMPAGDNPPAPLQVTIDTLAKSFTTVVPHTVPERLQADLRRRLGREFVALLPQCDAMLATSIERMLDRGRGHFRLEPDPAHAAYLRNVLVYSPWPASTCQEQLQGLLGEFDPMPDDPAGPTWTLADRLDAWLRPQGEGLFKLIAARRHASVWTLAIALGWNRGYVPPDDLLRTFRDSTCPTLIEDCMLQCWHRHRGGMTVATLLASPHNPSP
jgi:hypothetical protein